MLGLALLVATIALADSVNPSTLIPGLYFAGRPRARGLAAFIFGFAAVNVAGGVVLVLGPGPALIDALENVGPLVEHLVEACFGVALLLVATLAWRSRQAGDAWGGAPRERPRVPPFALGAGIAALELPTAFMYFGAISAMIAAGASVPLQVGLVVLYNALFVLPLAVLLAIRLRAGERAEQRLAAAQARLRRDAPRVLAAITGTAGAVLASLGAVGLLLAV